MSNSPPEETTKSQKASLSNNNNKEYNESIEGRIEGRFNLSMKRSDWPLLKSFDVYKDTLPVRLCHGEYLRLYKLPYWVNYNDLRATANQLETSSDLKYVVAPSGSGKTAGILPAFLETTFRYYLYIAFANNHLHDFKLYGEPNKDIYIAEDQGAAFIFECVKILLESPFNGPYHIRGEDQPPPKECTHKKLADYLARLAGSDRILIHLDEHAKMCYGDPNSKHCVVFIKGAMEAVALVPCVTVVATYVKHPNFFFT